MPAARHCARRSACRCIRTFASSPHRSARPLLAAYLAAAFLFAAVAAPVRADWTYWQHDPATPGDWFDPANWTNGVPDASKNAVLSARRRPGGTARIDGGEAIAASLCVGEEEDVLATVIQTDGPLEIIASLTLGLDEDGRGRYELQGGELTGASDSEFTVGNQGIGTFVQSGGTVTSPGTLFLARMGDRGTGSEGTYELIDGQLISQEVIVGHTGDDEDAVSQGTFLQTGGVHHSSSVRLGSNEYAVGTYDQQGGEHAAHTLSIGDSAGLGVSGAYNLSAGTLTASTVRVGHEGLGTFTQTAGTHGVIDHLWIGYEATADGTYDLQDGALTAHRLTIGKDGTALFTHAGGTLAVDETVKIGPQGRYEYTAGNLDFGGGHVFSSGVVDLSDTTATLNVAEGATANFLHTTFQGHAAASFAGAPGSFTIFPAGFDPAAEFASYTNAGYAQSGLDSLTVPAGYSVLLESPVDYPVTCAGLILPLEGDGLDVTAPLTLQGTGAAHFGSGTVVIDNSVSSIGDSATLEAHEMHVGNAADGHFTQTGGTVTLSHDHRSYLSVGHQDGVEGTYELSGGHVAAGKVYVGYEGTGHVIHAGGVVEGKVLLGYMPTGNGTYELSGTGELRGGVGVGRQGAAYFIQRGGTVTACDSGVGVGVGSNYEDLMEARYELRDGTVDVPQGPMVVNNGLFDQSGGTFVAKEEWIGEWEPAEVRLTGGRHTVLAKLYFAHGTYELGGTAYLSGGFLAMRGTFIQTGGTNAMASIEVDGTYTFTGGTFAARGLEVDGALDFSDADLDLAWDDLFIYLDQGGFENAQNVSLALGPACLVIHPPGAPPGPGFESFTCEGIVHERGATLVIPAGRTFEGTGSIPDPVQCAGTLSHIPGTSLDLDAGVSVTGSGEVNLGGGTLTVDDLDSGLNGGTLIARDVIMGQDDEGRFVHAAGTNTVGGTMYIGFSGGNAATYEIGTGAHLVCEELFLAYGNNYMHDSDGYLVQTGGTVEVTGTFFRSWKHTVAQGHYEISDGVFIADQTYMGCGTFLQTGGTVTVNAFRLAWCGDGSYDLQGGDLSAEWGYIGHALSTGTFNQTGGTFTVERDLSLGGDATGVRGIYNLGGGTAEMDELRVGFRKPGELNHSGGSLTARLLKAGVEDTSTGEITLSDTAVMETRAEHVGLAGTATFTQTGGTNRTGYLGIGPDGEYVWTGGTLEVDAGMKVEGTFDAAGQTWAVGGDSFIMNFAGGAFAGAGGVTLDLGTNSLAIVPDGFDPATAVGSYANAGMTHTAGETLVVGPGEGFGGSGEIDDHVDCAGTVVAGPGNFIDLHAGATVRAGGIVDLGWGTVHASGGTTSVAAGALAMGTLAVGADAPGTFAVTSPAATVTVSERLHLGPHASLTAAPGTTVHMTGSAFENESTDPSAMADLANIELVFEGGDDVVDPFEVAGLDSGPVMDGFDANFALGALTIGGSAPGHVQLADAFDNQSDGDLVGEALYVGTLTLGPASSLDLNGLSLYYRHFANAGGSLDLGGGSMMQVPEPATLALLALGGLGTLLHRRRRRTRAGYADPPREK